MYYSTALLTTVLSTMAAATEIAVTVGAGGLAFSPNMTTAQVGDVINFTINKNHSVAQSSFSNPCNPINDNAIFSGFGARNFRVTVNDTKPIWIYCSQASHCATGPMVFAVNPTEMNTLEDYARNAQYQGPSVSPMHVGGGIAEGSNMEDSSSSTGGYGGSGSGYGGSGYGQATATGASGAAATGGSPSGNATTTSGSPSGNVTATTAPPSSSAPKPSGAAAALDTRSMGTIGSAVAAVLAVGLLW